MAFGQKLRYFTDQNGPRGDHVKMNFQYSNSEMNVTENVDQKNGVV